MTLFINVALISCILQRDLPLQLKTTTQAKIFKIIRKDFFYKAKRNKRKRTPLKKKKKREQKKKLKSTKHQILVEFEVKRSNNHVEGEV